jgi:hypothetical protein
MNIIFPREMELYFSFFKNLRKRDRHTLLSFKGATIWDHCKLHHSGLQCRRILLSVKGATIFVRGKNEHLLDASRRRSFSGEVASDRFGSYSLF